MRAIVSPVIEEAVRTNRAANPYMPQGAYSESVYLEFASSGLMSPAVGRPYYFKPNPIIDGENAVIRCIEVVNSTAEATLPAGVDNLGNSALDQAIFVAANAKRETICTMPLYVLSRNNNSGKFTQFYLDNHSWQDCYVFLSATSGITGSNGLWFRVYYDKKLK